jgi:Ca-activated chloride channel family protein
MTFLSSLQTFYLCFAASLALTLYLFSKKKLTHNLLLRISAILLISLALAQPSLEKVEKSLEFTVLVDISDSQQSEVAQSLLDKLSNYQSIKFEFLPFAAKAAQVTFEKVATHRALKQAWGSLDIGQTNLEEAVKTALSLNKNNLLLISDAQETQGNLLEYIKSNSQVKIYPLIPEVIADPVKTFKIKNIFAPLVADTEKSVDIRIALANKTDKAQSGRLEVTHGSKTLYNQNIDLAQNSETILTLQSDPSIEGINEVTAKLFPAEKTQETSSQTIYISGAQRERVLLLNGAEEDFEPLQSTLKKQAFKLDSYTESVPSSLDLSKYSAIILNNIAYRQLPSLLPEKIKDFVSAGGGLILIGGNRSFGLGGYINTEIEEISPLDFVPPQTIKKRLNVAVSLVIDKSRSMAADSKLDFAKEAATAVIKNLKDDDFIEVIGFDSAPFIVIKMAQLSQVRSSAAERVARLFPAGRTNLLPAMDEARRSLITAQAGRKHAIILTDGKIPDAGPYYTDLVEQMAQSGISVSTVMLGSETDTFLLKEMAKAGSGSFHQTTDPSSLPSIFLKDIKVNTGEKTLKESQEFEVRVLRENLKSTSLLNYPLIRGYVQTKAKPAAELELLAYANDRAEPLLASWNYGKGRSIAFTSDANGRWSSNWTSWSLYSSFWSEILEAARSQGSKNSQTKQGKFSLRYYLEGTKLKLDLSIFSEKDAGQISAEVIMPNKNLAKIDFANDAKGHYLATLDQVTAGKYEVILSSGESKMTPVAFNLSGENFGEKKLGLNLDLIEKIATITSGKINPTLSDLEKNFNQKKTTKDLSWIFILLGIFVLCYEIWRRQVLRKI